MMLTINATTLMMKEAVASALLDMRATSAEAVISCTAKSALVPVRGEYHTCL